MSQYRRLSSSPRHKINLLDMNRRNLRDFFSTIGEKPFRADQVMQWIYHCYCDDFNQMTDLNKPLREKLKSLAEIHAPEVIGTQYSSDGTVKWSLQVIENQYIEMVYLPEGNRATLCVSSQVGCALQCAFCATGQQGFNRNLRVSEIIGQVWRAAKIISSCIPNNQAIERKCPITHIVMMGMGEPLLNLSNVITAIEIMLDNFGFNFSKRHVTLSTVGIIPALDKLINRVDIALAISLHAPNNTIRDKIVPINKKYNIDAFLSAVRRYLVKSNASHGRVTVEYVMLHQINDEPEHAHQLAECLKEIPCIINLIPWNSFYNAPYRRSSKTRMSSFLNILVRHGFTTIVRKTRGDDINAACGQLVGKVIDRTHRNST